MASSSESTGHSENRLALLRRLQEFSERWVDGDGHGIYSASAVLASCRDKLPEIYDALLSQESIFSNDMAGIEMESNKELSCIPALAVHEIVHAFVQNQLAVGGQFEGSGVSLAMSIKLGKGFRARNIEFLLRVCYKRLEDTYKARSHAECVSYDSEVIVVDSVSASHAKGSSENSKDGVANVVTIEDYLV